ncbi:hypothetical protein [Maricaulis sp.]|uniref:hypothetical protein n=1 Tax=Maricaulis sp. TaxID=1486257 RepID=UPI000C5775AC|nr:hypothetical protein [Maricaulis sp.]MAC89158.1 hypothetical protein [Maricaulis sp.]
MISLTLFLLGLMTPDSDAAVADAPRSGSYAELSEDGRSTCGQADSNRFELLIAPGGEPPHNRSTNVGEIEIRIEGERHYFVLTATPDRWQFGGGRQHTVGIELGGVTSAFLTGRLTLNLERARSSADPSVRTDALRILDARYSPVRRGHNRSMRVYVADGATPGGRMLRPFLRCGDYPE